MLQIELALAALSSAIAVILSKQFDQESQMSNMFHTGDRRGLNSYGNIKIIVLRPQIWTISWDNLRQLLGKSSLKLFNMWPV